MTRMTLKLAVLAILCILASQAVIVIHAATDAKDKTLPVRTLTAEEHEVYKVALEFELPANHSKAYLMDRTKGMPTGPTNVDDHCLGGIEFEPNTNQSTAVIPDSIAKEIGAAPIKETQVKQLEAKKRDALNPLVIAVSGIAFNKSHALAALNYLVYDEGYRVVVLEKVNQKWRPALDRIPFCSGVVR